MKGQLLGINKRDPWGAVKWFSERIACKYVQGQGGERFALN